MFSGRISEAVANQIEKKIAENNDLNSLSNSELAQLAIEFVGDAPPSNVPRETVINILSEQPEISNWRANVKKKAIEAAKQKVANVAKNVDPRMASMIKQQFGQWLQNSGLTSTEITTKIDVNSDGEIGRDELAAFIENLSGTQPPDWVCDTLIAILDADENGKIEVHELWSYLAAIGFDVPTTEPEIIEPPVIVEEAVHQMVETTEDEIDIDAEIEQIEDTIVDAPASLDNDVTISITETQTREDYSEANIEQENTVETSIEIGIERLHSTRLHREATSVIESTSSGDCTLLVERVERTLMVMDEFRGGMTVVGLLDNGPYTVSVLFEPEFNEQVEKLEGKSISFTGKLFDWSSGLRQAKLKGTELTF